MFLYSTNSWLAYAIAEKYFGGIHYVWCSEYFNPSLNPTLVGRSAPPTSSPKDIFSALAREVQAGDKHSAKVASIRSGLVRGIQEKNAALEISNSDAAEAEMVVHEAGIDDFFPVLYVISKELVKSRLIRVSPSDKAHPLSSEFKIERLARSEFDLVDFVSL